MKMTEQDFLNSIAGTNASADNADIMPLDEINEKLKGLMPKIQKRGMHPKESTVLGVESIQNVEGIVKIAEIKMIPPGEKRLERARKHLLVADALPRVITPILVKNGSETYILLCAQDRVTLGGKVSIEVYRGSVPDGTEKERLGLALIKRKLPNLDSEADLLQVRDLGYFWNNTGLSGMSSPVQALFYITKKVMPVEELKASLKLEHGLEPDPKTGPVLPSTEPILKTLPEIEQRLDEIRSLDITSGEIAPEAYINDLFSMTALFMLLRSIDKDGMPY